MTSRRAQRRTRTGRPAGKVLPSTADRARALQHAALMVWAAKAQGIFETIRTTLQTMAMLALTPGQTEEQMAEWFNRQAAALMVQKDWLGHCPDSRTQDEMATLWGFLIGGFNEAAKGNLAHGAQQIRLAGDQLGVVDRAALRAKRALVAKGVN